MKNRRNDKVKIKKSDQQSPEKTGILSRFLNWLAKGAKNSCPT
jgi:hypothetical protein